MEKVSIFCPITVPYKSGAGQNAFNLAKAISKHGKNVKIISFNQGKDSNREIVEGIEIFRIPFNSKNRLTKSISYFSIIPPFLKHLIASDLAIIFGPLQGYMVLILAGKFLKRKVLFRSTMYGKDDMKTLNSKFGPILYRFRKQLMGNLGGYISQSPAMTRSIVGEYGNSIPILESAQGVNTDVFYPSSSQEIGFLRERLCLPKDKIIIISIGYLIERKGYREIFEALNTIMHEVDFHYIVVGNYRPVKSHYMYYLQSEMKEIYDYGIKLLGDKVRFLGESNEVDKYLRASDIFILNSVMEGMPNVLLEAMACGIPSVVKTMEGVDNYITVNECNSLIVDDVNAIAINIRRLASDNELHVKLGKTAARFILENFSISKVSLDIIQRFKSL